MPGMSASSIRTAMHKTPAQVVIDVFNGATAVAKELDLNRTSVWSWSQPRPRGLDGFVPSIHHRKLLKAAKKKGLKLTEKDLIWGRPSRSRPQPAAR